MIKHLNSSVLRHEFSRDKSDLYLLGETSAKELGLELGNQGDNPLTIMNSYSLILWKHDPCDSSMAGPLE